MSSSDRTLFRRAVSAGAIAVVAALALAGCGFRPLYGGAREAGGPVRALAAIKVESIPDRLGRLVRNNLLDRLSPGGEPAAPRYRLKVVLETRKEGLAIRSDEIVTRFNFRLMADFELRDARTGSRLFDGRTRSFASYNVVRSDYANLSAERDAESRTAREISDEIAVRLAVYLSRVGGGRS